MDPWLGVLLPHLKIFRQHKSVPNNLIQTEFSIKFYFYINCFKPLNFERFGFYAPVRLFFFAPKKSKKKEDLHVLNILHALERGQDQTHSLTRERGFEPPTFSVTD